MNAADIVNVLEKTYTCGYYFYSSYSNYYCCRSCSFDEKKGNNEQQNTNNVSIEATENPENVIPTVEPVQTNTLNIPPATEENDLLQIVKNSVQEKHCYLTFDDSLQKI